MTAFYNEIDPNAAAWLRELIQQGHIAPGVVDERSIEDIRPEELMHYTQCHFFAGIGVWSYALRRAGWADDIPCWTGSCPCQPFSPAGKGGGFDDERHLWPSFAWLIEQCKPAVIFGEQVASKAVEPWVDLVHADVEALGYAFGAVPFPSAGVGAPHIRDRLFWVADSQSNGHQRAGRFDESARRDGASHLCTIGRLANADGGHTSAEREQCGRQQRQQPQDCSGLLGLANTDHFDDDNRGRSSSSNCRKQQRQEELRGIENGFLPAAGPVNGFWGGADWIGCRDDRFRPVEPGTFPLANGAPARVGRLRGYGNAINAQAAQVFIESYLDTQE